MSALPPGAWKKERWPPGAEDMRRVDAGLPEATQHCGAEVIIAHQAGGGDVHAQLGHGGRDVGDIAAGSEVDVIEKLKIALGRRLSHVHRRGDEIGDDDAEDGGIHCSVLSAEC